MIELGWMRYGNGKFQHMWQYDQPIGLLRSFCHTIWRNGDFQDFLLIDPTNEPKCQRCLRAKNRVVD